MSEHLIAEANRHAKALPKMTLPTTKPNDLDLAWYRRECELLQDRNEALERENAALRIIQAQDKENYQIAMRASINVEQRLKGENAALREDWQLSERRWVAREKEWAEKTVEIEKENAALRAERVLVSVHTGKFTTISGRAMICPDCGRALLHENRAVIDAARKEAQPLNHDI